MTSRHTASITYLRLSVTDRCDLRCAYCMHAFHNMGSISTKATQRRCILRHCKCMACARSTGAALAR